MMITLFGIKWASNAIIFRCAPPSACATKPKISDYIHMLFTKYIEQRQKHTMPIVLIDLAPCSSAHHNRRLGA